MWHGGSALVRSGDESGSTLKCCTMHITFNIWRDMCLKAPNHACREECISEAVVSRCRSSCSSGCSREVWLPPAPPVNLPAATYLDNCVCPPVSLILHLVRLNVDGQKRSWLPPSRPILQNTFPLSCCHQPFSRSINSWLSSPPLFLLSCLECSVSSGVRVTVE